MALFTILSGALASVREKYVRKGYSPVAVRAAHPDHRRSALRNSAWMLVSRVGGQVFAAALTIIVARGLGQGGLGQYAFIASLLMIANVFTTFGTDTYLIREIAARPDNAHDAAKGVLLIQLLLSGLVIVACWIFAQEGNFPPTIIEPFRIFSLSLIPLAFYSVFSALLRAREKMYEYMLVTLLYSGLQSLGALIIISLGGGLTGLAYLTLAATFSSSLIAGKFCRSLVSGRLFLPTFSIRVSGKILQLAFPLALLTALGVIYQRSPVVLLTWLAGENATGWYSASFRVVEMFKLFHLSLLGGLFPLLARIPIQEGGPLAGSSRENFRSLRRWSFTLLIAISLAAVFFLKITAPAVTSLVYGNGFEPSASVLQTQAWVLLPYALTSHQSLVLVVRGQEQWVLLGTAVALVLLIGLSLSLIPMMGAIGAAWSSLAGETVLAIILGKSLKR
jgi:O-antigen/teichoic acid export membrane protein